MQYYTLKAAEKELRVRVRMRDHEELDRLCGGSFMAAFSATEDPWKILKAVLTAGCHAAGDYKAAEVDDIIDQLIDEGATIEDAGSYVLEIGTASGFFTRKTLENYRAERRKASRAEETQESESESL